jgi:hypothetical protein
MTFVNLAQKTRWAAGLNGFSSGSSSKSLIIKLPEFCSLMKPGNVGVAEATARLSGYISGQKAKAWIVKDLGLEPPVYSNELANHKD